MKQTLVSRVNSNTHTNLFGSKLLPPVALPAKQLTTPLKAKAFSAVKLMASAN